MNKAEKQQVIEELTQTFRENSGILLMDFTGLNVADVTELRRKIRESGSHYRVIKNTLALRAAVETTTKGLEPFLEGPTAMAYTSADPVALAKLLSDFARTHPQIKFKGGVLESSVLSAEQAVSLADMPSRPELLAKLLFLLNAPLMRLATALQSPVRNLMSVLKQLETKKQAD
jgi:large subunit ribosomal protein L10